MALILDGRQVSERVATELQHRIVKFKTKPCLAIIQVGDLSASNLYIKRKILFADLIGVEVKQLKFSSEITELALAKQIKKLNQNKKITGIIVQLPLSEHLDITNLVKNISPEKDVDGLSPDSMHVPATARGVVTLLDYYKIKIVGQKCVVVGRSNLVGKPIALALLARNATVVICHRQTKNLARETKTADVIIVATGRRNLIGKHHVKSRQIVVDVGITFEENRLHGDVDYLAVSKIVKAISPVPGGVGPMTVASLFANVVDAYDVLQSKSKIKK